MALKKKKPNRYMIGWAYKKVSSLLVGWHRSSRGGNSCRHTIGHQTLVNAESAQSEHDHGAKNNQSFPHDESP